MTETLVPIAICVVLPALVVWLTSRAKINKTNKDTEVFIEAIKHSNDGIDTDTLIRMLARPVRPARTPRDILYLRLLRGAIFTFSGLAIFIITPIIDYGINPCMKVCIFIAAALSTAIGLGYLITYRVSRKNITDEKK